MNDGGPAFPQGHMDGPCVNPEGMSLRDWFAGQVLAGMAASSTWSGNFDCDNPVYLEAVSEVAYTAADAMLKARGGDK